MLPSPELCKTRESKAVCFKGKIRLSIRFIHRKDRSLGAGNFPEQPFRIVIHFEGKGFLIAADFQIVRHTPRVPAGAASAKRHFALGHHLSCRVLNLHDWIQ